MRGDILGRIARQPQAWAKDIIQADSPHAAELDASMARATEAVAYRCLGNVVWRSFPTSKSVASIAAINTWTDFTIDAPTQFPFRLSESYRGVGAILHVVTNTPSGIALRIQTKTLAGHTVTTTNGAVYQIHNWSPVTDNVHWLYLAAFTGKNYFSGASFMYVDNPNLDATRRFVVQPQAQISDSASPRIILGGSVDVFLKSILIVDLPDHSAVAW